MVDSIYKTIIAKEEIMFTIKIKNLRLRTIIGVFDEERNNKQDIIVNIKLKYEGANAIKNDDFKDALDYKILKKEIMVFVENSKFFLLEKLVHSIMQIIMKNESVLKAKVKVDKPNALRFADSVSLSIKQKRK